jgi:tetratricopeptide (TPR) repeat protein
MVFSISLFFIFSSGALAMSCESKWNSISGRFLSVAPDKLLAEWKGLNDKCEDNDLYQLRVVILQLRNKNYSDALKLIESEISRGNKYRKELMLRKSVSITDQFIEENNVNLEDWNVALSNYEEVINSFPDWWQAYAEYGSTLFLLKQDDAAIFYSEESIALMPTVYAYIILIKIKYNNKLYDEVISYYNKLLESNLEGYRRGLFMVLVAKAYANLENYKLAKETLNILANENKAIMNTEIFKDAMLFVDDQKNK